MISQQCCRCQTTSAKAQSIEVRMLRTASITHRCNTYTVTLVKKELIITILISLMILASSCFDIPVTNLDWHYHYPCCRGVIVPVTLKQWFFADNYRPSQQTNTAFTIFLLCGFIVYTANIYNHITSFLHLKRCSVTAKWSYYYWLYSNTSTLQLLYC